MSCGLSFEGGADLDAPEFLDWDSDSALDQAHLWERIEQMEQRLLQSLLPLLI